MGRKGRENIEAGEEESVSFETVGNQNSYD
jgi:hypothetical protein